MGKSSRAFYQREIKGQKRELLESVETDKFGGDKNLAKREARRHRTFLTPQERERACRVSASRFSLTDARPSGRTQAALERAAAAPKVLVVSKIKPDEKEERRSGGAGASGSMDIDGGQPAEEAPRARVSGEERLRRVLSVTGCGVLKRHKDKKSLVNLMPVQPNKLKERRNKKAAKRMGGK